MYSTECYQFICFKNLKYSYEKLILETLQLKRETNILLIDIKLINYQKNLYEYIEKYLNL